MCQPFLSELRTLENQVQDSERLSKRALAAEEQVANNEKRRRVVSPCDALRAVSMQDDQADTVQLAGGAIMPLRASRRVCTSPPRSCTSSSRIAVDPE